MLYPGNDNSCLGELMSAPVEAPSWLRWKGEIGFLDSGAV